MNPVRSLKTQIQIRKCTRKIKIIWYIEDYLRLYQPWFSKETEPGG